jgi:hypothetical protein
LAFLTPYLALFAKDAKSIPNKYNPNNSAISTAILNGSGVGVAIPAITAIMMIAIRHCFAKSYIDSGVSKLRST